MNLRHEIEKRIQYTGIWDDNEEDHRSCLRGYQLRKLLGQGAYGKVFEACEDTCEYAVKIVELDDNESLLESFALEALITEKMSKLGVAPKLYGWWFCESDFYGFLGIIAMQKLAINKITSDMITVEVMGQIRKHLEKMKEANVIHADLHYGNMMGELDSKNKLRIFFIDWGWAFIAGQRPNWLNEEFYIEGKAIRLTWIVRLQSLLRNWYYYEDVKSKNMNKLSDDANKIDYENNPYILDQGVYLWAKGVVDKRMQGKMSRPSLISDLTTKLEQLRLQK